MIDLPKLPMVRKRTRSRNSILILPPHWRASDLARKVNVSAGCICNLRKGRISPSFHLLIKLVKATGCYPHDLFPALDPARYKTKKVSG